MSYASFLFYNKRILRGNDEMDNEFVNLINLLQDEKNIDETFLSQ